MLFSGALHCQQKQMLESQKEPSSLPSIIFSRTWANGAPQYFKIEVTQDGRAVYSSQQPSTNDPQVQKVDLAKQLTLRIFVLAQRANYFQGNFDYSKHKVAQTGLKTLAYSDAGRHFQTSYNWSENASIEQLTQIFEGLSQTLESGRKLATDIRYDRLGVAADLQSLEDAANSGEAVDLELIHPILVQINSDTALMHIAQQRAGHLLALAARGQ